MKNQEKNVIQKNKGVNNPIQLAGSAFLLLMFTLFMGTPAFAHCDSYDGPVIKDAISALETDNVDLVLKWVTDEQEAEIIPLFNKTYRLKTGDADIYKIVERHFFETLVRLHRETEGAPYTGLKPAGTTKAIIKLTDHSIESGNSDDLVSKLNNHIAKIVHEKHRKVAELSKVKNISIEKGREYVEAYVDYTHTVEAFHDILEHGGGGHAAHQK